MTELLEIVTCDFWKNNENVPSKNSALQVETPKNFPTNYGPNILSHCKNEDFG